MRAAIAMVLVMSITGCAMTRQQKALGIGVGAALAVAGVAAVVVAREPCDTDVSFSEGAGCIFGSAELFGAGLALGALGLGTMMGTALAPTIEPEGRPVATFEMTAAATPAPDPAPASLAELAAQASVAAHGGRCVEASALADRIEMVDPEYRFGAFVKDAAIAACVN